MLPSINLTSGVLMLLLCAGAVIVSGTPPNSEVDTTATGISWEKEGKYPRELDGDAYSEQMKKCGKTFRRLTFDAFPEGERKRYSRMGLVKLEEGLVCSSKLKVRDWKIEAKKCANMFLHFELTNMLSEREMMREWARYVRALAHFTYAFDKAYYLLHGNKIILKPEMKKVREELESGKGHRGLLSDPDIYLRNKEEMTDSMAALLMAQRRGQLLLMSGRATAALAYCTAGPKAKTQQRTRFQRLMRWGRRLLNGKFGERSVSRAEMREIDTGIKWRLVRVLESISSMKKKEVAEGKLCPVGVPADLRGFISHIQETINELDKDLHLYLVSLLERTHIDITHGLRRFGFLEIRYAHAVSTWEQIKEEEEAEKAKAAAEKKKEEEEKKDKDDKK